VSDYGVSSSREVNTANDKTRHDIDYFSRTPRPSVGPSQPAVKWVRGGSFQGRGGGVKRLGSDDDHLPLLVLKLRMSGTIHLLPHMPSLRGWGELSLFSTCFAFRHDTEPVLSTFLPETISLTLIRLVFSFPTSERCRTSTHYTSFVYRYSNMHLKLTVKGRSKRFFRREGAYDCLKVSCHVWMNKNEKPPKKNILYFTTASHLPRAASEMRLRKIV